MKNELLPIIGLLYGIVIGAFLMNLTNEKDNDHKVCAKAIEVKAHEADSINLELARLKDDLHQCEDLYRELNNQPNENRHPKETHHNQ